MGEVGKGHRVGCCSCVRVTLRKFRWSRTDCFLDTADLSSCNPVQELLSAAPQDRPSPEQARSRIKQQIQALQAQTVSRANFQLVQAHGVGQEQGESRSVLDRKIHTAPIILSLTFGMPCSPGIAKSYFVKTAVDKNASATALFAGPELNDAVPIILPTVSQLGRPSANSQPAAKFHFVETAVDKNASPTALFRGSGSFDTVPTILPTVSQLGRPSANSQPTEPPPSAKILTAPRRSDIRNSRIFGRRFRASPTTPAAISLEKVPENRGPLDLLAMDFSGTFSRQTTLFEESSVDLNAVDSDVQMMSLDANISSTSASSEQLQQPAQLSTSAFALDLAAESHQLATMMSLDPPLFSP